VHQLTQDELPLIPLWQLPELLAVSANVKGVPARPLTLYQDVENWQIEVEDLSR
jgi:hypothetical protein